MAVSMTLQEIRRLAHALGIMDTEKLGAFALIRLIQFEEGHMPCFSEAWSAPCKIDGCPFSAMCSSNLSIRAKHKH